MLLIIICNYKMKRSYTFLEVQVQFEVSDGLTPMWPPIKAEFCRQSKTPNYDVPKSN